MFSGNKPLLYTVLLVSGGGVHRVKRKWKFVIGVIALAVIAGGVVASVRWSQRDLVTVQTGKVSRADLTSVVTASGEIKPRTYINLGANAQGIIVELLVREG